MQNDVVHELFNIGLQPVEEVLVIIGYRLDAVVDVYRQRIGIEVDGPTHFIDKIPTGNTILKGRQMFSVDGIPIVSVPYWDWNKLGNDSIKKQEYYLCSRLGL